MHQYNYKNDKTELLIEMAHRTAGLGFKGELLPVLTELESRQAVTKEQCLDWLEQCSWVGRTQSLPTLA